jgi:lipid A disaccharide synthetase
MLNIAMKNPIIENFYQDVCNQSSKSFENKILHMIQLYNAKEEFKKVFEELEEIKQGKIEPLSYDEAMAQLDD